MKILIADDNEDARNMLRSVFENIGHTVTEAVNGEEALARAYELIPDLIISDILMPKMDGFRLCRRIKLDDNLRKIPFIFYTGTFISPDDEKLALSLGASRYISKPANIESFLKIVQQVVDEYKEGHLSVTETPFTPESDIFEMYKESIGRKFDEKVRELELYRQIFINSNEAISVIDSEGFYREQNSSHRVLFGYPIEELKGKNPAIYLGESMFAGIYETLKKRGVYRGELIGYKKSGEAIYVDLSVFPISDEKGAVIFYISIARDTTTRKKIELELRERVNELERFYETAVNRELKMKELKEEIAGLKERLSKSGPG